MTSDKGSGRESAPSYVTQAARLYRDLAENMQIVLALLKVCPPGDVSPKDVDKTVADYRRSLFQVIEFEAKIDKQAASSNASGAAIDLDAARDEIYRRCVALRQSGGD